ncbi:helix-turn-helix domain-containing protein [Leptospira sp. GIMC2001]|uniref:helix-turn-helix domain-containing protein n=1 Tax=Leptospira sp. GIMC2001 TaxID=1513297 RepID=UPI00234A616A|nr:helix-turn-helix domain-containing protein [Leptospira sp. GIMC2001]WCL50722.1 helix-turn-helix domain-containing protein [Leptospira sp. GIMC2001]
MRTGTWISSSIGSLPISSSAKIILAEIDNLHKAKVCRAGNAHFADILGVSTETVSRIISKLRKLGFVKQVHFDGRIRILEPSFEILSNVQDSSKFKIESSSTLESAPNIEIKPALINRTFQNKQKHQSSLDHKGKREMAYFTDPLLYKKHINKSINNSKRRIQNSIISNSFENPPINIIHDVRKKIENQKEKNWNQFVEWAKNKFSGSTKDLLLSIESPNENLPATIRIAWDAWL